MPMSEDIFNLQQEQRRLAFEQKVLDDKLRIQQGIHDIALNNIQRHFRVMDKRITDIESKQRVIQEFHDVHNMFDKAVMLYYQYNIQFNALLYFSKEMQPKEENDKR